MITEAILSSSAPHAAQHPSWATSWRGEEPDPGRPTILLFPGIFLSATVLSVNLLATGCGTRSTRAGEAHVDERRTADRRRSLPLGGQPKAKGAR